MHIKETLLVSIISFASTGSLFATEIYRWIDEQGVVHYGDSPSGAANEERLTIISQPTDANRIRNEFQPPIDAQFEREQEAENAPPEPIPEKPRVDTIERAQKCNMYRERQIQFTQNRRVYRMGKNGDREYYSEEEMRAVQDRVQALVAEYCD
jgi:hypothetical protein